MKLSNLPTVRQPQPTQETEIVGGDKFFKGIFIAMLIEFGVVGVLILTVYLVSLGVRWLALVR